jgi:hypothetical protein
MSSDKSFKQKLSSIFKTAALATALAVSVSGDNAPVAPVPASTAPLTENEIAFVQSIFGNEVNTAIVTKVFYAEHHDDTPGDSKETAASVNDRKNINFYGTKYYSSDYSQEDALTYGVFIHEMTHIWQRQKIPGLTLLFMSCHTYNYTLDSQSRFSDFCIEQQGAIIEDYARRFLHPSHASLRIKNTPENDALLKKVVEAQFPEARKTRLAAEKQQRIKMAAAKTKSPKI